MMTSVSPRPLHGIPLTGPTGLQLLISSNPPRLLDVDRGTSRTIAGLPTAESRLFWVQAVGVDADLADQRGLRPAARDDGGDTDRPRLGRCGIPGRSRGVAVAVRGHDALHTARDRLDGRPRRQARRVGCGTHPRVETPLGLLVWTGAPDRSGPVTAALLDPDEGRTLVRFPEIHAIVGELVLSSGGEGDQGPFTVTDRRTGARHQVVRPSTVGSASDGLVSPDRQRVAIAFENPAWAGTGAQVMDVWLLDAMTYRWERLPAMPVPVALKFTSMAWADDGRLLLLGSFDGAGDALAVWRPGQDQLAIRPIPLPEDRADTFMAWEAPHRG